mgnify:FL=1
MFPALYSRKKDGKEGAEVRCHSTTRSPIAVSLEKEYPLHSRYELKSYMIRTGERLFTI